MITISPTRVSMYDFLYQDTKPMVSLLADAAQLSLPQTRIAMNASLQAIVSALLAYQQRYKGQAVAKKLFTRSAIKELRQYNSMNLVTLKATLYYRQEVTNALFNDSDRIIQASEYIASQIDAEAAKVQVLLTTLCVIALRELAILADYSQLDYDELDKWFALQPQFLSTERFISNDTLNKTDTDNTSLDETQSAAIESNDDGSHEATKDAIDNQVSADNQAYLNSSFEDTPPPFEPLWYELTKFRVEQVEPVQDMQQATSNYLKVIGRARENAQKGQHDDMLVFAQMHAIALPHQRWLLQLAKISDIYLSRNRLRITSEPESPPTRPLVSLGFIDINKEDTPATPSETPIEYDKPPPLWKNPVILITLLVIAVLGALAMLKYQMQQSNGLVSATEAVAEHDSKEERKQQDVAIVRINEDEDQTPDPK